MYLGHCPHRVVYLYYLYIIYFIVRAHVQRKQMEIVNGGISQQLWTVHWHTNIRDHRRQVSAFELDFYMYL